LGLNKKISSFLKTAVLKYITRDYNIFYSIRNVLHNTHTVYTHVYAYIS